MYCECEYGDGRLPLLFIVNPAAHSGEGYALWKQAEAFCRSAVFLMRFIFQEKQRRCQAAGKTADECFRRSGTVFNCARRRRNAQ